MASASRRSARHLIDEIRADGPRFRFFQAVRLLALATPGQAAIPAGLRFASPLSLAFQASEIARVEPRTAALSEAPAVDRASAGSQAVVPDAALSMVVGFMGLTGPSGILPTAYSELLIDRRNRFRDNAGHQFLDLFTHRAVSLFYRAWRKHRFYLAYEAGTGDGFSRNILDLVGVGLPHLAQRLEASGGVADRFLIHYAGLLAQKPVSAASIAALVGGYFGASVELEQFVGQWMPLPRDEQSTLGSRPCCLGRNTFVGERLWDRQAKVRLRIGPLDRRQFGQFLPGQPALRALRELVRFCLGLTTDCDVTLILKRSDIPRATLSKEVGAAARLGYDIWLHSAPPPRDAADVCFALLSGEKRS